MDEILKKYTKGIKDLLELLDEFSDEYKKVTILQEKLTDNLESIETFGDNENLIRSRKQIIEKLNDIALNKLHQSFNKIAGLTEIEINDYRNEFRERVFSLYNSLGFEIIRDHPINDSKVDMIVKYNLPLKKSYKSMIKCAMTVEDLIGEQVVARYAELVAFARSQGVATIGEIVTDIGFTTEAQKIAKQEKIQLLTYSDCINYLLDFDRYIDEFIYDFEHYNDFAKGVRQSFIDALENADLNRKYVLPKFTDIKGNTYTSINSYINEWLKSEKRNELVILGQEGAGKTALCLYLSYELAKSYKIAPEHNRIPIYISLKDYSKCINHKRLITDVLVNRYRLNFSSYAAFKLLLKSGKFVLILDGMDELNIDNNKQLAVDNYFELSKLMMKGAKTILTSDTHHLLNQPYAEQIFQNQEKNNNQGICDYQPKYDLLFLQNFEGKQVADFLKTRTQNWQAFYVKIKSIPNLMKLVHRAYVLDMIWKTLVRVLREDATLNYSTFYDQYTRLWIEAFDEESIMNSEQRSHFVEALAFQMLKKGQLYIHNTEISNNIKVLFKDYLRDYSDAEVFAYDVGVCPFLVEDKEGNYKFKHKSLVEFFVAKKYVRALKENSLEDFDDVTLPFEVKNFIVELMPKKYTDGEQIKKNMVKISSGKSLKSFWIDKYGVTNSEYHEFIKATKFKPPMSWRLGKFPKKLANHPVVHVAWTDAFLYAKWIGKRLPSEKEWEKAAGYDEGRQYPWGNEFNAAYCNSIENGKRQTVPVNFYHENASPYGCYGMAGNVWEWTSSWVDEMRRDFRYVAKGGSFWSDGNSVQSSNRLDTHDLKISLADAIGFRCAYS